MNGLLRASAIALFSAAILAACSGGGDGNGTPATNGNGASLVSITVTPAAPSIAKGTSQQFRATGLYGDYTTRDITASVVWSSSDANVAVTDNVGKATSASPGSTTITATLEGKAGTGTLTVTNATLSSIALTPANASIAKGTSRQFTATGTFSDASTQDLTTQASWSSSDTGKATVNGAGLASSVAVGSASISAALNGVSGSATLTVTSATLVSLAVTPAAPITPVGKTRQFTATGRFSDGNTQDMTLSAVWSSSSGTVASIDSATGLASALSTGSTEISAVSGTISGGAVLTVSAVALPMTGQAVSYATGSAGDDGAMQAGVAWPEPRFTIFSTPTPTLYITLTATSLMTDKLTGLMWAQEAGTMGIYDPFAGVSKVLCSAGTKTWQNALDYVACLNQYNYLGHTDWRVPNIRELESVFHAGYKQEDCGGSPCATNADWLKYQGFSNVQTGYYYWSSTTNPADSNWGMIVSMNDGGVDTNTKTAGYVVWPVRDAQIPSTISLPRTGQTASYDTNFNKADDGALQRGVAWPGTRFTVASSGTGTVIIDNLTGLTWASDAGSPTVTGSTTCTGGALSWQEAIDYVACLNSNNYLGHGDWRLPNRKELWSLIQYGQSDNAAWLQGQGFSNVQSAGAWWSSTTYDADINQAWYLWIPGYVRADAKTNASNPYPPYVNYHAWPVRGGQ